MSSARARAIAVGPDARPFASGSAASRGSRSAPQRADSRPARFSFASPFCYAPAPGINGAASFHEARYVAHFTMLKNRGQPTPYAIEGLEGVENSKIPLPRRDDVAMFASQASLPPIGRPGAPPLPTQPLGVQDSYHFARAVRDHSKFRNLGVGNPFLW
eukprot:CAMPEP_0117576386 /NCGR_PEP_ID=MMETSP0784-20121206/62769_1 /TAXON_ID=39447 /ORGANISM="" /LENGTH=158 /DNA_ID=CAMNT_0005375633 /DNA_START=54 /DNA_END=527 /DNA_ORIENTATION=-